MNYAKSAETPEVERLVLKYKPAELKKHGRVRLFNLKDRDGVLVAAQRYETVEALSKDAIALFASSDTVYSSLSSGCVRDLTTDKLYVMTFIARGIVTYCAPSGEHADYVFGQSSFVHAIKNGEIVYLPDLGTGSAGAIFRERLFLAQGSRLSYSAPLDPEKFALTEEDTGKIELSDAGGDILALIPHGDRLLVFRTHEILKLRADANDLNFSFSKVKFDGGEILAGSIQSCGRLVVFRTQRGLYTFDGDTCKRTDTDDEAITLVTPAVSGAHAGLYYARAKLNSAGYMFVFDPETEESYLVGADPVMIAGNAKGLWFGDGSMLLRAGEEGDSVFNYSLLACEFDLTEKSSEYVLESVTVTGKGSFTLSVQAGSEQTKDYKIKAYEEAKLRRTLPLGKLRLNFHTFDEDVVISGVILRLREAGT